MLKRVTFEQVNSIDEQTAVFNRLIDAVNKNTKANEKNAKAIVSAKKKKGSD